MHGRKPGKLSAFLILLFITGGTVLGFLLHNPISAEKKNAVENQGKKYK